MKTLIEFIKESSERQYVDAIIKTTTNKFLALRRANYMRKFGGMWGVVGGSVESHEATKSAAIREVFEETQIRNFDNIQELKTISHDDGSISTLFLMTVNDNQNIKISREHSQYKWISSVDEIKGRWMPQIKEEINEIINNLH